MVTKDQLFNGFISYLDSEVIPQLPTSGKWGLGAMAFLIQCKYEELYSALVGNAIVKAIGVTTDEGMIDADKLFDALSQSASKYGDLKLSIPMIGTMTFSSNDISKLRTHVGGGSYGGI